MEDAMTFVDVYRAGTKVASREIQGSFLIVEHDDGEFTWRVDGEPILKKGGAITVWFIPDIYSPRFQLISQGWQLIVDGMTVLEENEVGVDRLAIPINGKIVELKHGDLSFVFQLPSIEE
jgi:hypothetical protein